MPTYDYVCDSCDHAFELFQQMSAPVEQICPKCGARSLRRLVGTGGGIIFKGSGFYETDYRSAAYKKAADSDRKPESTASADKKSDTSKGTSSTDGGKGASGDSASGKSGGSTKSGTGSGSD